MSFRGRSHANRRRAQLQQARLNQARNRATDLLYFFGTLIVVAIIVGAVMYFRS